jgi:hypothetical protein
MLGINLGIRRNFMRNVAIMMSGAGVLLSLLVIGAGAPARAAEMPSYFKEIVGTETATPADIATKNLLQLNTTMFELYGNAAQVFRKNTSPSTRSSSDCSRAPAGDSSSIARACRRSMRRRCRWSISCSSPSGTAPWRWRKWSRLTSTAPMT